MSEPDVPKLLRLLLEQASEHAVILLEPDGRIIWCNEAAERIFAVPNQTMVGRDLRVIFTTRDQQAGIDRLEMQIASAQALAEDDRWHARADGSQFWSSGALLPIIERGKLLGFGKILRDRTDLKTQVDLLSNQLEALRESDRAKDRAITTLVHELRNGIAGLRGSVDLLDVPLDDASRRVTFAALMRQQLDMLTRLSEDLLEAKRAETFKLALELEPVVLQAELRALAAKLEQRLRDARLNFQLMAPDTDIVIHVDRVRFQQILMNVLDNAIKYTPAGGRIWLKVTAEDRWAVVRVEDTGCGVPSSMLQRIFELFTQVDASASKGGLGVGLALVRQLVSLHGGIVQASSKGPGLGSEFTVRLPLAEFATNQFEPERAQG